MSIIRNRVDSFGVAEAEVTTAGDNIVISVPGKQDKNILEHRPADRPAAVPAGAGCRCRRGDPAADPPRARRRDGRVRRDGLAERHGLAAGVATPEPDDRATTAWSRDALRQATTTAAGDARADPDAHREPRATPAAGAGAITAALPKQFAAARLHRPEKLSARTLRKPGADDPKQAAGRPACDDGAEKYILGPAEVLGTDVKSAGGRPGDQQPGRRTGGWQVNLDFTGDGTKKFADTTRRLAALQPTRRTGSASSSTGSSSPRRR